MRLKYLEIIPNFLSMYGVFTSPNTSQVRQEMSITLFSRGDFAKSRRFREIKPISHFSTTRDTALSITESNIIIIYEIIKTGGSDSKAHQSKITRISGGSANAKM